MKQEKTENIYSSKTPLINIFADSQKLIDSQLAEILPQVAVILSHQGYPQAIRFLEHNAVFNTHEIINCSQAKLFETSLKLLVDLLAATLNNQGNPEYIHFLLQDNPNLITSEFIYLLKSWGIITLSMVSEQKAAIFGSLLANFGGFVMSYPHGNETLNIEVAIAALETTLPVFSNSKLRSKWAIFHNNLALAYSYRLLGDRLDNIHQAYHHYDLAKRVFLRQAFPQEWVYISIPRNDNININSLENLMILPNNGNAA